MRSLSTFKMANFCGGSQGVPFKTEAETRKSDREKYPTWKVKDNIEQEVERHSDRFSGRYEKWTKIARECKALLLKQVKGGVPEEDIMKTCDDVERACDEVTSAYDELRKLVPPDAEVRRRADKAVHISKSLVKVGRGLKPGVGLNNDLEDGITDAGASMSSFSFSSKISSKRAEALAEAAADKAYLQGLQETAAEKKRLSEKEAEMQIIVEEQRRALEILQARNRLKVAQAKINAYNDVLGEDMWDDNLEELEFNPAQVKSEFSKQTQSSSQKPTDLATIVAECVSLSRLPAPEPPVFTGDPIQFTDWKVSFHTLIDRRKIPSSDKMFYLKRYIGGQARRAVEGFFLQSTEEAYLKAWRTLEERYGNPFVIKKAYRDKISSWPKIGPKDALALQDFADFLQSCNDAMEHVGGSNILDDYEENHKLLAKLPDWVIGRWNRVVVDTLDSSQEYPAFVDFSRFLAKEAKVACNPVSSLFALKGPDSDKKFKEQNQRRTNVRSLTTQSQGTDPGGPNNVTQCNFCKKDHTLGKCRDFAAKKMTEKKDFIQRNRLCFGCLRKGHFTKDCKTRHTCGKCKKKHPTCLHVNEQQSPSDVQSETATSETREVTVATSFGVKGNTSATAMIVPVWVSSAARPGEEILTYALLDTQSDTTFILQELGKALDAERYPVKLKLSTLTSSTSILCEKLQDLRVRGYDSKETITLNVAYTKDAIPMDRSAIPTKETAQEWSHLSHIANQIQPLMNCEVGMLIGYDCPHAVAATESVLGKEGEPCGLKTALGWSVIGPGSTTQVEHVMGYTHRVSVKEIPIATPNTALKLLESDFQDESCGESVVSQEDLKFVNMLESSICQTLSGHYVMPLPFRDGTPSLPDNRHMAAIRLGYLKRKFQLNEKHLENYTNFMNEIIQRGDAELVPESELRNSSWYIPHQGVNHAKKAGKFRVVFDCSAKFRNTSLNDHLLTGPDLTNSLVGVLCRFRKHPVALMCDVEKMFHQFLVAEEDRNFLRFLWWKDGDIGSEPLDYRMKVHLFGAASSPGCANFGLKHLAKVQEEEFPVASQFILHDFYVDDGLTSMPTASEVIALAHDAQEVCKRGGLRLHKFISNNVDVNQSFPTSDQAKLVQDIGLDPSGPVMERCLGIQWDVQKDCFKFTVKADKQTLTRRGILSVVASIYDPLGFLAPFVLGGKLVLQEMCRKGTGWDEPLAEELVPRWEKWSEDLKALTKIEIPRWYAAPDLGHIVKVELHHFSDGSSSGYGQCSYIRFIGENKVHCSLVAGKARVAPTKITTIPRLELTAAVISVKMSDMLKSQLRMEIHDEWFWTDSQIVLAYVNNDARRFHVFVANRITRIKQSTNAGQWCYVETSENPADHASRGLSASELSTTNWFTGPRFLWERDLVPKKSHPTVVTVDDPEVKQSKVLATQSTPAKELDILNRLSKFSKWTTALKAVARLKRLARRDPRIGPLTVEECKAAEMYVLNLLQENTYKDEIAKLNATGKLSRKDKLHDLDPYLHDGLLRVGGRLQKSSLPDAEKHPVIIPSGNHVTSLIVKHYHEMVRHQGRGITLNCLRSNGYWVVGGSKTVASLIHSCVLCRRMRRPVEEQRMADLPDDRVEMYPPFLYCGMDCFGPFQIKQGRKEVKRWGLIFTCMCSRAVHIEPLDDMTTDAFINALRCFLAIRGQVHQIRCDQGSNFVGAKGEFSAAMKELDSERIQTYLVERQCDFVFNAPSSSHAGGVWERQIRSIRNILTAISLESPGRLDDSSFRTFLYEAMSIINGRPLSVENQGDPQLQPLTPNHILTMKSSSLLPPPGSFVKQDSYLRKRWRRVQYLTEQFWGKWRQEYLKNIALRQKWHTPKRNLAIGDIVIVKDDNVVRNQWPIARVEEVKTDEDGLVRRVKVLRGDSQLDQKGKRVNITRILERPIQKIVLLLEGNKF